MTTTNGWFNGLICVSGDPEPAVAPPVIQQPAANPAAVQDDQVGAAAAPAGALPAAAAAAGAAGDNVDGLGAAHHALLQREAPTGTQPYVRPTFFPFRVSKFTSSG